MDEKAADKQQPGARAIALTDLVIKAISAVGLIIVGVVGWRVQNSWATSKDQLERHDREERRFLPMLQTLSELQLWTARISVTQRSGNPESVAPDTARRYGTQLVFLADSLVMPDGELLAQVTPAERFATLGERSRSLTLSLRCATIMLGELAQLSPDIREHPKSQLLYVSRMHGVLLVDGGETLKPRAFMKVDTRSESCWNKWLPTMDIPVGEMFPQALDVLAAEVDGSSAAAIHGVLAKHPDLADRYVEIRRSALSRGVTE